MPSTSSANLHAVQPTFGEAAVFFLNPRGVPSEHGALMEKTPQGTVVQLTRPFTYVSDFSAGLDRAGNPDVFVHLAGQVRVWDGHGFTSLNQPEPMLYYAAVQGGRAYFEGQDHALWQYTIPFTETLTIISGGHVIKETITVGGWKQLAGPNSVYGLDAVTQPATGSDAVFAIGRDLSLQWIDVASGTWTNLAPFGQWLTFELSAGLDENGYAAVWTQIPSDEAVAFDTQPGPNQGWHNGPTLPSNATMLSATNNKTVWVLYNGQIFIDDAPSNITALSAASSTDAFVMAGGHLYEVNVSDGTVWHTWY